MPVARQVIATTHRLTRAATLRNPLARNVRNLGFRLAGHLPPVRQRLAMNLSELATVSRQKPTGSTPSTTTVGT